MSSLDVFGQEFKKKPIAIFEINTLKFVNLQNFTKKQKCLNLVQKISDFGVFGLEFRNDIVVFEISTLQFV